MSARVTRLCEGLAYKATDVALSARQSFNSYAIFGISGAILGASKLLCDSSEENSDNDLIKSSIVYGAAGLGVAILYSYGQSCVSKNKIRDSENGAKYKECSSSNSFSNTSSEAPSVRNIQQRLESLSLEEANCKRPLF